MKTLQITEQNARKLYPDAAPEFKAALEDTFGKNFFSADPAEWAKSFEDFLAIEGKKASDIYTDTDDAIDAARKRIEFVAGVLNKDQSGTPRYYPYFDISGGGFSFNGSNYDNTYSYVGARLRVFSSDHAYCLGRVMLNDYKTYLGY